jgi:hypothetical protein
MRSSESEMGLPSQTGGVSERVMAAILAKANQRQTRESFVESAKARGQWAYLEAPLAMEALANAPRGP